MVYNGGVSEPPSFWLLIAAAPPDLFDPTLLNTAAEPLRLLGGLVFLGLAAFFTAGITVLSALTPFDTKPLLQKMSGYRKGLARSLLNQPLHALASVQLGRTFTLLAFAWFAAPPLQRLLVSLLPSFPGRGFITLTVALLVLSVMYVGLIGQLVKPLASRNAYLTLHALAPSMRFWQVITYPFALAAMWISRMLLQSFGLRNDGELSKGEVLKRLLEDSLRSSDLDAQEKKLLTNVIDFSETRANDIMVPRTDVMWLSINTRFEQVMTVVSESGHTRFPVCDGSPDKVIGYLHAKDLTPFQRSVRPGRLDLRRLARPVAFVPETARAITLLKRFQEQRSHLAVVVDEFGGMSGVITLEDLLEELVGEIRDEFDVEEPEMQLLESGELIVDGAVRLDELEESLSLDFGDVEEETIGGYIFGRLAREVEVGEELTVPGATLRVEEVEGLRITLVRIIPTIDDVEEPGEELVRETRDERSEFVVPRHEFRL